jgi:hypothetical protein
MIRKPQNSIISALAKIGGILAFFKISVFLNIFHQRLFIGLINNEFNSSESGAAENSNLELKATAMS